MKAGLELIRLAHWQRFLSLNSACHDQDGARCAVKGKGLIVVTVMVVDIED